MPENFHGMMMMSWFGGLATPNDAMEHNDKPFLAVLGAVRQLCGVSQANGKPRFESERRRKHFARNQ
jgi:hypothetical protein